MPTTPQVKQLPSQINLLCYTLNHGNRKRPSSFPINPMFIHDKQVILLQLRLAKEAARLLVLLETLYRPQ